MATELHNASAAAYAQALLELADERKQVDAIAGEMSGLGKAVSDSPLLASFFGNPSIKEAEQEGVLNRALLPHVSPLVGLVGRGVQGCRGHRLVGGRPAVGAGPGQQVPDRAAAWEIHVHADHRGDEAVGKSE